MNYPPTHGDDPETAASSMARFAYAGGSRPLEGYTIKRGIGHGGFGEVYYATSDAGKEVALKLIRRSLEVELRGIKQCLNLRHPNLLSVYDIKQDPRGDNWVVMEYVAGDSLDEAIARHPDGMPVEEALAWFHGIAAGVAYLHDHGIVHRDLKPGNIFSDEGRVEIGDYGLSKFISCSRRSGHTESVGTVHYMAPEVANGRYGKEIDIYALGIVLYEMLTGRVPFEGESVGEVLMKHLTAKPDVSMLAEPYRSVIARALEKDPAERFKSIGEMLALLPRPAGIGGNVGPLPSAVNAKASAASVPPANGTPAAVGAVPVAEAVDEEPVLRALREFLDSLREGWRKLNTPAQIFLTIFGVIGFMMTAEVLIPLGVFSLILYGGYRVIRAIVLAGDHSKPKATSPSPVQCHVEWSWHGRERSKRESTPPPTAKARARRKHYQRFQPREEALAAMIVKPARERIADLFGSMLLGAVVAATMCLIMVIVAGFRHEIPRPEQCAWLLLVSIAGAWAVMVPSKLWEGTKGEGMLRRFVLMVLGLGLGAFAWVTAKLLMVPLLHDPAFAHPHGVWMPSSFYDGGPLLLAYLAVFGTLMAVIRWWTQADPLRTSRLSLWSMFVTSAAAGLVAWVWHFPQPWLIMVACTMSASVQLASPWLPTARRQAARED